MSENKHSCRIGTIVDKSRANEELSNAVLAPSPYWLLRKNVANEQKITSRKYAPRQESWKTEEIIIITLSVVLMIVAVITLVFTKYCSNGYYHCIEIFSVLLAVFLLIALWMECKNRNNRGG